MKTPGHETCMTNSFNSTRPPEGDGAFHGILANELNRTLLLISRHP